MEYSSVTAFINKAQKFGSRLDLTRIEKLCAILGHPEKRCRFVHIAGTNGKGSTSVFIENILVDAGYKTGLFTSPYICEFNERIQINNTPISDESLADVMEEVALATQKMLDEGFEHPTEFELVTALAFLYFAREKCDVVVLEVGLGGILDATNVIKNPLVSVITSISYDHTEYLGESLREITENKCGIIKEKCPVVSYAFQEDEALEVIIKTSKEKNCSYILCDTKTLKINDMSLSGNSFSYNGKDYITRLVGEYQIYNAVTAINTAEILIKQGLRISPENIKNGIEKAKWQARFEVLRNEPIVICDGSHNKDGMSAFVKTAKKLLNGKKVICVFGMLKDKEYEEAIKLLSEISDTIIVTEVLNPRYETVENLGNVAEAYFDMVYKEKNNEDAVLKAKNISTEDDVIVALGSLYMMKSIKDAVKKYFDKC